MKANTQQAVKQVVAAWRKRMRGVESMFSSAQQKAFVAEEVMSLVLSYAVAEKVQGRTVASASDFATIYREALKFLGVE